jgi:hypothetical protein
MTMKRRVATVLILMIQILFLHFPAASLSKSESGHLICRIYHENGAIPVEGSEVFLRNITTRKVFKSSLSNVRGVAEVRDIKSGVYYLGVLTKEGGFGSESYMAIKINKGKTVEVSVALKPYSEKEAMAVREMILKEGQEERLIIGQVRTFYPDNDQAEVNLLRGFIKLGFRIRIKGKKTDFVQEVENLMVNGSPGKQGFPGDKIRLAVKKDVRRYDLIILEEAPCLIPIFLFPIGERSYSGAAVIIGATAGVVYKTIDLADSEEESSPFKK